MISCRISPQDCLSLSHYYTGLPGAGPICAHIRGLPKASGGRCRFVELLIVLLSHFCCSFSPLPTAFQDRDPVWIPQARELQLSVGALITAHPQQSSFHSTFILSRNEFLPMSFLLLVTLPNGSVCTYVYTCVAFYSYFS